VFEVYRAVVMRARLLPVSGRLQREGLVIHVVADHLEDRSEWLSDLDGPYAPDYPRADEVIGPEPGNRHFPIKSWNFH
jgi:error-prone DNA polymerase